MLPAREWSPPVTISKEIKNLGMPWEEQFGYAQGVKVGDTIYLAGQVSHDENGRTVGKGDMEAQMRQAYANVEAVLAQFGATMDNIVSETTFVTDMDAANAVAGRVRHEVFGGLPQVTSTLIGAARLASPDYLIEIRVEARA